MVIRLLKKLSSSLNVVDNFDQLLEVSNINSWSPERSRSPSNAPNITLALILPLGMVSKPLKLNSVSPAPLDAKVCT